MGSCIGTVNSMVHEQLVQDRVIRWDQSKSFMARRTGEVFLKIYENIEDTKGQNGLGTLTISNLRIIWVSNHNPKLNISIGLGNISYIHFNMADSSTFGRSRAPHMMTQLGQARFEFTFASRTEIAFLLFNDLDNALMRFKATRVFRDLVLRDKQLMDKEGDVRIYHGEKLLKKFPNCTNLASNEKFAGTMFMTDRRIVWNSILTYNVNVSIPYVQLRSIGTRCDSHCGSALVVEATQVTGGFVLGFQFENQASLCAARSLLTQLFQSRSFNPYFGPLDGILQYIDDQYLVICSPDDSLVECCEDATQLTLTDIVCSENDEDEREGPCQVSSGNVSPILPSLRSDCPPPSSPRIPFASLLTESCQYLPLLRKQRTAEQQNNLWFTQTQDSSGEGSFNSTCSQMTEDSIEASVGPLRHPCGGGNGASISTGTAEEEDEVNIRPLGETLNLQHADPLLIGLKTGQASVVYSASNEAARAEAKFLLSISPSSKKYRAPRCVICMSTTTEAAFDPCGHLCSCMTCAAKLKQCPICRSEVEKLLRIYLHAA